MEQYAALKGAIHIHSRYSDGSDSMEKIIAAAKKTGLDYVVVTDHNVLKAKRLGWDGWHDGVLVIVGCEISARSGHCLALNIDHCKNYHKLSPPEYLQKVKDQGGISFVAHPHGNVKREFALHLAGWEHWDNPNYAGMEIWSYMHDWIDGCHLRTIPEYIRNPEKYVTGPPPEVLRAWDEIAQNRRIAGLGALDNHAAHLPLRKLPWYVYKVFPHEFCFRTVRTHVLMPQPTKSGNDDTKAFLEALERGRCFVDYATLADGTGFSFTAACNGKTYHMGDEIESGSPIEFSIMSPKEAEITVMANGLAETSTEGTELTHKTDGEPGVYRVEARLKGKPWIFSNHIYVR